MKISIESCYSILRILLFVFTMVLAKSGVAAVQYIDIWEYQVDGNTLLKAETIQRSLKPYLGAARTLDDVEKAAQALQSEYKAAGYPAIYVEIPPQTVVAGVFKLQVTETYIRRLRITGSEYFLPSLVKRSVPSLEPGQPLKLSSLQQEIQLANTMNQDLKVVPIIKQGPTPNTIDVELDVVDEFPITGGIEINNYSTADTTDTRLSFDIGYSNLWQKYHSWSLQAQVSPEDTSEVAVLATTYIAPLGLKGNKLAGYVVVSDSDIATVGNTRVVGEGFILGARYISPFQQKDGNISTLILGFDYKDFDESIGFRTASNNPIRYVSFTGQYSAFGRSSNWNDSLSLGLTIGVRDVVNDPVEFDNKRSKAEANFATFKADYERTHTFEKGWSITGRIEGQITDSPLVSNEQISAGGVDSVRGYFESQVAADVGVIASLQAQTKNLSTPEMGWLNDAKLLAFVDAAHLLNRDSKIEEEEEFDIASAGVGFRALVKRNLTIRIDSGYPLKGQGSVQRGDIKTGISVRYDF